MSKKALTEAKSSTVHSYGYDPKTRTLTVKFHSGGTYHYYDVPPDTYEKMVKAQSIGKFMKSEIRDKGFKFERAAA